MLVAPASLCICEPRDLAVADLYELASRIARARRPRPAHGLVVNDRADVALSVRRARRSAHVAIDVSGRRAPLRTHASHRRERAFAGGCTVPLKMLERAGSSPAMCSRPSRIRARAVVAARSSSDSPPIARCRSSRSAVCAGARRVAARRGRVRRRGDPRRVARERCRRSGHRLSFRPWHTGRSGR